MHRRIRAEAGSGRDPLDARLVGPAVTVWAGMWLVTSWSPGVWVVAGASLVCAVVAGVATGRWAIRGAGEGGAGSGGRDPRARVRGGRAARPTAVSGEPDTALRVGQPSLAGRLARAAPLLAIMLASCWLVGGLRVANLVSGPVAEAARHRSVIDAVVEIRDARASPTWGIAVVDALLTDGRVAGQDLRARLPVVLMVPAQWAESWLAYPAGARVQVVARLGPAELADGTAATLSVLDDSRLVRPPPGWQRVTEAMRRGLANAMRASPSDQAGLVPALVVGDTSAMPAELAQDFQATGLTHLTAVSGANLAIALGFASVVARRVGVRGHWLTLVSVLGTAAFVVLCHSEPSVLRAGAMGLVCLAALGHGGGAGSGLRGICLAVIGLCWIDPWMARSVGFALSVLACAGIVAWAPRWAGVLASWLPRWLAEAVAVPLAAQLATQPVVCWLSGAVSLAGLLANALAGVWVAPATVIGLLTALVSLASPLVATGVGYLAGWCAQPILTIAESLARLPGASHPWPTTTAGLALVAVLSIGLAWIMPAILRRAWLVALVATALLASLLVPPFQPGWPAPTWRIAACDVGQGDAVVVRTGPGQAILIDVGPGQSGLEQCLGQLGIRDIPLVVLTHFHADHAGGLAQLLDSWTVGALLVPAGGGDATVVRDLADQARIPVAVGRAGMRASLGQATVTVVSAWQSAASTDDAEESAADNDESLVVRVDTPEMSLLDTGDLEQAGQLAALAHPGELRVDVLKVAHHGSARQSPSFLQATGAVIALISVGADNAYGHPAARTVEELVNQGMAVVRTDEHGSITVSRNPDWTITTQR